MIEVARPGTARIAGPPWSAEPGLALHEVPVPGAETHTHKGRHPLLTAVGGDSSSGCLTLHSQPPIGWMGTGWEILSKFFLPPGHSL